MEGIFLLPCQEHQGLFRGLYGLYGLQFVTFSLPWFIYTYSGSELARKSLIREWAELILLWGGGYLMPLYPPLALAGGLVLAEVFHGPSNSLILNFRK